MSSESMADFRVSRNMELLTVTLKSWDSDADREPSAAGGGEMNNVYS